MAGTNELGSHASVGKPLTAVSWTTVSVELLDKVTSCQQMKRVNYTALVDHAECVARGI